ncbi:hypothetical protein BESB_052240 [Besnoitia besnoiti]|uniref:HEAT repeat-containing protein n=1 Tax=Besnoitia besnoiti TaxID=94643 RepID=A0A2A9MIV4_BESBE|nr:hypothetical protein BESB_052240 [Besnoitia besnoiti]PFH35573.1 hypothetical protein BESB_052240 [Besnoitia besnoiti]
MAASLCAGVPQALPPELEHLLSPTPSPEASDAAVNAVTDWLALPARGAATGGSAALVASERAPAQDSHSAAPSSSSAPASPPSEEGARTEADGGVGGSVTETRAAAPPSLLATRVQLLYRFLLQHLDASPALASAACDFLPPLLEASSFLLSEAQREFLAAQRAGAETGAASGCVETVPSHWPQPHPPRPSTQNPQNPYLLLLSCATKPSVADSLRRAMTSAPHCFYPPPPSPLVFGVTVPLPLSPSSALLPSPCPAPSSASHASSVDSSSVDSASLDSSSSSSEASCLSLPVVALVTALSRAAKPRELFIGLSACLASSSLVLPSLRLLLLPVLAACCGEIQRKRAHFVVQASTLVLHATLKTRSRAFHVGLHQRLRGGPAADPARSLWGDDAEASCSMWERTFRPLYPPQARRFVFPEAADDDSTAAKGTAYPARLCGHADAASAALEPEVEPDGDSAGRGDMPAAVLFPAAAPPALWTLCALTGFLRCMCVALAAADIREGRVDAEGASTPAEEPDERRGDDPRAVGPLTVLATCLRILELFVPMTPDAQLAPRETSCDLHAALPRGAPAPCGDEAHWSAVVGGSLDALRDACARTLHSSASPRSSLAGTRPSASSSCPSLPQSLPGLLSCLGSLVWAAAFLHERHRGGLLPSLTGLLNTTALPSPNQGDLEISPFSLAFLTYLLLALPLCGVAALPSPLSALARAAMAFRASFLLLSYANPHAAAALHRVPSCSKKERGAEGAACGKGDTPSREATAQHAAAAAAVHAAGLPERHTWLVERKAEQLCLLATDFLCFARRERPQVFAALGAAGFCPQPYWKLLLALLTSGGNAAATATVAADALRCTRNPKMLPPRRRDKTGKEGDEDGSSYLWFRALPGRAGGARDMEDVQVLFECFSQATAMYPLAVQEDLCLSLIHKAPQLPDAAVGAILILLKRRWTDAVLRVARCESDEAASAAEGDRPREAPSGDALRREDALQAAVAASAATETRLTASASLPRAAGFVSAAQVENAELLWRVIKTALLEEGEGTVLENSERLTTVLNWLKLCIYNPPSAGARETKRVVSARSEGGKTGMERPDATQRAEKGEEAEEVEGAADPGEVQGVAVSPSRSASLAGRAEGRQRGVFEQFGDWLLARGEGELTRALEQLAARLDMEHSILRRREDGAEADAAGHQAPLASLLSSVARECLHQAHMPDGVLAQAGGIGAGAAQLELLVPSSRGGRGAHAGTGALKPRKRTVEEEMKLALTQQALSDVRQALQTRRERRRRSAA